jgi:outer membrane protein assembly factor BamB
MARLALVVLMAWSLMFVNRSGAEASSRPSAAGQDGDAVAYQLNTTHSGGTEATTLSLPFVISWKANLQETPTYPIIAGGRVFAGGNGSFVYALDAQSGTVDWSKATTSLGMAFDAGQLFSLSSSGYLSAFQPVTGRTVWFEALPFQYSFSSPPTARNGFVYTGGAGEGGTVYAVAESNGTLVWSAQVENGDNSSPVVTDNGVYVSYVCPQTYDFAPKTGALIWHYSGNCEGGGGATPALHGTLLYVNTIVSNPPGLILRASDGKTVGSYSSTFTPAFASKTAYLIENNATSLVAVSTVTGNVIWTQTLTSDSFSIPPLVLTGTRSGDLVVCATAAGNLVVFDANKGSELQNLSLGTGAATGGMAFAHGLLVVPTGDDLIGLR